VALVNVLNLNDILIIIEPCSMLLVPVKSSCNSSMI